ncbi:MAG: DNA polymerase III subunit gamma/tau [Ruminococcaceae bacterium]|nr:DNA polymerase III subunit gamma/tau [Oscillospiraceae bacterium]
MHQALYRKWRPKTFSDVCGQEHITSVLRYEVEHSALSHAYLFCGSRGTGKTTCAKILAKAANCEHPVDGSPCGKCAACVSIDNGSATDVLEMDAASNNGVESIRDIRDEVVYTPSALKYRVYIVDEVHMLSISAFNALLKTLEEPPAHVIFILATTELHKLPNTIISRCQRFDFRRIAVPVLAARISYIAKEEGFDLTPEAAERIAKSAQGGMRDAISLLELCGSTRRKIDVETVNEMMGSGGRDVMFPLVRAVLSADYDTIFSSIDEAVSSSRDLAVFWQDLISIYRDMLVLKTTSAATKYLDLTDAETAQLTELAGGISKATLLSHCRLLEDALFAMQKANAVKRMVAELTLVRMCDPALDTSPEGMLARLSQLEDKVAAIPSGVPSIIAEALKKEPSAKKEDAPAPAPKKAPPVTASAPTPAVERSPGTGRVLHRIRGFMNCVERVRRENAMLAPFLDGVKAYTDEKERIVFQFSNDWALGMFDTQDARALLARALSAEMKRPVDAQTLVFEVPSAEATATDTILDDLLEAAEQQ